MESPMRRAPLLLALLTAPVGTLAAQDALPTVGQRVRLKTATASEWIVGTLAAVHDDSLRLWLQMADSARLVSVARGTVTRFELSRGRHSNAGKGAVYGAAILGSLGLLTGVAIANSNIYGFRTSGKDTNGGDVALFTLGGIAYGAGLGALIGALSHSERWETVLMNHVGVTLTPRGAGLRLSLAF